MVSRQSSPLEWPSDKSSQVPWIYQAEFNSMAMRVRGAAAATSMNWVSIFDHGNTIIN
jgi:hypothetical protein